MNDGANKKDAGGSRGPAGSHEQHNEQGGSRSEMTEAIFSMFRELVSMAGQNSPSSSLSKEAAAALTRFTQLREAMDMTTPKAELDQRTQASGG